MSKTASPFWCKIKGVSHAGSWCNIWFFRSVHRLTGPGWCLQMAVKFKLFHLHPLISCHPQPPPLITCCTTSYPSSLVIPSGGSRISPRWGRQPSGGQHTILPNFPKNCMKWKEFVFWGAHVQNFTTGRERLI